MTCRAQVFQGKYKGQTVAIKQFNNPEKLDDREFRKELAIMSLVREPARVLPCLGGSSKKGNKFIGTPPLLFIFISVCVGGRADWSARSDGAHGDERVRHDPRGRGD